MYPEVAINIKAKTSSNGQIDIVCRLSWVFQTTRWNNYYILFVQSCIFEILWHTQAILQVTEFMHWNVKRLICTGHWLHCLKPYKYRAHCIYYEISGVYLTYSKLIVIICQTIDVLVIFNNFLDNNLQYIFTFQMRV